MTTVMKLRIDKKVGDNLTLTVFAGVSGGTLQNAGSLILKTQEYQLIGTAMSLGAEQMGSHHFEVIFEGEKEFGV